MIDTLERLRKVSVAFRETLEQCATQPTDFMFSQFPKGACGPTSELLGRYLTEAMSLNALYVCGRRSSDGFSHAWIMVDDLIIDITADQFAQDPVIVTRQSLWHLREWLIDEAPRPPICSRSQWPMYPSTTWLALVAGMTSRGFPAPRGG